MKLENGSIFLNYIELSRFAESHKQQNLTNWVECLSYPHKFLKVNKYSLLFGVMLNMVITHSAQINQQNTKFWHIIVFNSYSGGKKTISCAIFGLKNSINLLPLPHYWPNFFIQNRGLSQNIFNSF